MKREADSIPTTTNKRARINPDDTQAWAHELIDGPFALIDSNPDDEIKMAMAYKDKARTTIHTLPLVLIDIITDYLGDYQDKANFARNVPTVLVKDLIFSQFNIGEFGRQAEVQSIAFDGILHYLTLSWSTRKILAKFKNIKKLDMRSSQIREWNTPLYFPHLETLILDNESRRVVCDANHLVLHKVKRIEDVKFAELASLECNGMTLDIDLSNEPLHTLVLNRCKLHSKTIHNFPSTLRKLVINKCLFLGCPKWSDLLAMKTPVLHYLEIDPGERIVDPAIDNLRVLNRLCEMPSLRVFKSGICDNLLN